MENRENSYLEGVIAELPCLTSPEQDNIDCVSKPEPIIRKLVYDPSIDLSSICVAPPVENGNWNDVPIYDNMIDLFMVSLVNMFPHALTYEQIIVVLNNHFERGKFISCDLRAIYKIYLDAFQGISEDDADTTDLDASDEENEDEDSDEENEENSDESSDDENRVHTFNEDID